VVDVAVVGAGLGGMAVAARLAKLGHTVTLFEREQVPGGSLRTVERDGFRWDAGPTSTGLPAALRDLFRKSGRPIERYVELQPAPPRRHVFAPGVCVDLPTGSRAEQIRAIDSGLGAGTGRSWAEFVDRQADVWDRFRRSPAGPDWDPQHPVGGADGRLPVNRSLRQLLSGSLPDERLRAIAGHRYVLAGSDLREVPALAAVGAYVERSFGLWRAESGLAELADALAARLAERRVDVRCGAQVTGIRVHSERVTGVEVADGTEFAAAVVVAATDPLGVFADLLGNQKSKAARIFRSRRLVDPPAVTHLGLRDNGAISGIVGDVVLHGNPLVEVSGPGTAPAGHCAWTVRWRGDAGDDVLAVMAERGLDLQRDVVTRVDLSPSQVRASAGGSYAVAWDGWRAHRRRAAHGEPITGLYVLAASLTPGATIPQVAWTAAHVANRVGKA
jgi:phytoene dehydrogenase-like protein